MQAVKRVAFILDFLGDHPDGSTISEISELSDLSQSVIHRFLNALKDHNYVIQDKVTKRYKLSIKIFNLSMNLINSNDLHKISRPFIELLSKKTNSFVFLSIYENSLVICIDTVQANTNLSFFVRIGSIMPVNSSAAAQSIIAFLDSNEKDKIINELPLVKFTDKTLVDNIQLSSKLSEIQKIGYAVCNEELEQGVIGLSAPIWNFSNKVIGSITILKSKTPDLIYDNFIIDLKNTANKISANLGYLN